MYMTVDLAPCFDKIFSRRHTEIFFLFSHRIQLSPFLKTGFAISCKMSPLETICMKCQILFSGKNKKYYNLSSAELAQRVVKVKEINKSPF